MGTDNRRNPGHKQNTGLPRGTAWQETLCRARSLQPRPSHHCPDWLCQGPPALSWVAPLGADFTNKDRAPSWFPGWLPTVGHAWNSSEGILA